jgi:hypothetical protein
VTICILNSYNAIYAHFFKLFYVLNEVLMKMIITRTERILHKSHIKKLSGSGSRNWPAAKELHARCPDKPLILYQPTKIKELWQCTPTPPSGHLSSTPLGRSTVLYLSRRRYIKPKCTRTAVASSFSLPDSEFSSCGFSINYSPANLDPSALNDIFARVGFPRRDIDPLNVALSHPSGSIQNILCYDELLDLYQILLLFANLVKMKPN